MRKNNFKVFYSCALQNAYSIGKKTFKGEEDKLLLCFCDGYLPSILPSNPLFNAIFPRMGAYIIFFLRIGLPMR